MRSNSTSRNQGLQGNLGILQFNGEQEASITLRPNSQARTGANLDGRSRRGTLGLLVNRRVKVCLDALSY